MPCPGRFAGPAGCGHSMTMYGTPIEQREAQPEAVRLLPHSLHIRARDGPFPDAIAPRP